MRKEREVLAKHIVDWNRTADHYRRLFRRGLITEYEAAKEEARTAFEMTLYEHYFLETYRDDEGELPEFAVNLGAYEENMDSCKRISKSFRRWRAMHTMLYLNIFEADKICKGDSPQENIRTSLNFNMKEQ